MPEVAGVVSMADNRSCNKECPSMSSCVAASRRSIVPALHQQAACLYRRRTRSVLLDHRNPPAPALPFPLPRVSRTSAVAAPAQTARSLVRRTLQPGGRDSLGGWRRRPAVPAQPSAAPAAAAARRQLLPSAGKSSSRSCSLLAAAVQAGESRRRQPTGQQQMQQRQVQQQEKRQRQQQAVLEEA